MNNKNNITDEELRIKKRQLIKDLAETLISNGYSYNECSQLLPHVLRYIGSLKITL